MWFKINSVFGYILLDHTVHSEVLMYQYLCTVQERGTTHDCITHESMIFFANGETSTTI